MCCRSNRFSCGCGCGCGCGVSTCGCGGSSCGCGSWGQGSGITTLPSFPDRPVFEPDMSSRNMPVYVSLPASMTRGSANLRAAVDVDMGSGCPFARG